MADLNREAEELAEAMRQAAYEIRRYGKVSEETADALAASSDKRAKELKAAGQAGADALGAVASAALGAGKAMLDGKKGASAFNSSLDDMAKAATAAGVALTFLIPGGPVLKLFIAGVTAAVGALAKYTQAANEMGDKLYKNFSKMQQSGANASDGLTGLFEDAKKLGLSMDELDSLVATVANNAKGLAGFAGSVADGRKQLANIGKAMEGSRLQFIKMGIGMEELADATAGYMRLQSTTGRINRQTAEENATAVKKYILEQDALTKLTGMTRKEQEDAREEVRSQERFAAKLEELRQQGRDKEAKQLEDAYLLLRSKSKEAAQGFADISTGNLQTEASQKLYRSTQGEALGVAQQISAGQRTAIEGVQQIAQRAGETATRFGPIMGQLGTYNDTFGDLAGAFKLRGAAESDMVATLRKIEQDRAKMGDGTTASSDRLLDAQARLRDAQIKANDATERFVLKGVGPATEAMISLTNATMRAAGKLDELTPGGKPASSETKKVGYTVAGSAAGAGIGAVLGGLIGLLGGAPGVALGAKIGAVAGSGIGGYIGQWFGGKKEPGSAPAQEVPQGADGGLFSGPESGYMVKLHGTEMVIPEDDLKGKVAKGGAAAGSSKELDEMTRYYQEMTKDIKVQEQLVDRDTKRQQTFSILSNRLMSMKSRLMEEEVSLLEEQNDLLEKLVDQAEKTGGKEAAEQVRKMFTTMRSMGAQASQAFAAMAGGNAPANYGLMPPPPAGGAPGAAPPPSSGMGLKPPTGAPSGPTGQGLQIRNQDDLSKLGLRMKRGDVQAEGAKIDPKLIELAQQIQSQIPEFGVFTGFNDKFHNEKYPRSSHTTGKAVDFTLVKPPTPAAGKEIVAYLKSLGFGLVIDEYNQPSAGATGGHFHAQLPQMADGGVTQGPTIAGEAGPEAVVPLPDGRDIPVKLDFNNVMGPGGIGPTFAGWNDYTGYNQGPISTDLNVLKEISASMGAFDKASQTITNPKVWKEVLNSGIAVNYDVGMVQLGSKILPNMGELLANRIKELQTEQGVDQKEAFNSMFAEFRSSMKEFYGQMLANKEQEGANEQVLSVLGELVNKQSEANDISKKILQVSQ